MATLDFTALTPEQLDALFPMTQRPYAVWYSIENEGKKWVINDGEGCPIDEFDSVYDAAAVAIEAGKDYAAEARTHAILLAMAYPKVTATADTIKKMSNPERVKAYDEAHLALVRAKGIIDMIYMLSLGDELQSCMNGTVQNSLDTVIQQLREVEVFFDGMLENRSETSHVASTGCICEAAANTQRMGVNHA